MKLKNKTDSVRALRDNGQFIEVKPGEIIELEKPVFNEKVFEIITKKSKEKMTPDDVEKEELNIKEDK